MSNHQILIVFLILGLFISSSHAQLIMKRICFLNSGLGSEVDGVVICSDSDHNGLNEIIFRRYIAPYQTDWEVWEYYPMNRYKLVFADTGAYPYPPGITTGNFRPYDVGDIDGDSLTDLVGPNIDQQEKHRLFYNVVTTQESPDYTYYPENLSWSYRYANNMASGAPCYFTPDLDSDIKREIIYATGTSTIGTGIWENISNNQNNLVWNRIGVGAWSFAFGDYDLDSIKEFVTADLGSAGRVSVYENTGSDQYELCYQDTIHIPNGSDVFSGQDLDSDDKPEFFVAFYSYPSAMNYLYMWEATGNNTFQRTLISQVNGGDWSGKRSMCCDIDGDGIEELVWSIGGRVMVYKATGNNQFQQVWSWNNDHGGACSIINIYDINKNGYNEIVIGGVGKTSIFEMEAVRLLRPNGGEVFQDSTQELIRWQKFYPPRCDSLSLLCSTDNGRTYQSIIHSLQSADTSYLWTVPSVNSDSCKIKIIAYGPGWQYDESDGVFSITSTGIEEHSPLSALRFSLKVERRINPATIIFSIPYFQKVNLKLFDIQGRLIKSLVNESKEPGTYKVNLNIKQLPSGIYILSLETKEKRIIERIVIIK